MKYSATILLFAAAVLWSSASARPHIREQQDVIDAFTRWAIAEMEELPEPHKTNIINRLREAQHQHWDNLMEYMVYVQNMLVRYVRQSGIDSSRRKRSIDLNTDQISNTKSFQAIYARMLSMLAPPSHVDAVWEKLKKAVGKDHETFDDFYVEAVKIFEEVTGLDFEKVNAEFAADKEKQAQGEKLLKEKLKDDSLELVNYEEFANSYLSYRAFARILVSMAPPPHQAALTKKYKKALERDYEYFADFKAEAGEIFEEETGLNFKKVIAEIQADEGKQAEFLKNLGEEFEKWFAEANLVLPDSSDENKLDD